MTINIMRVLSGGTILLIGIWGGAYLFEQSSGKGMYEFASLMTTLIFVSAGFGVLISGLDEE